MLHQCSTPLSVYQKDVKKILELEEKGIIKKAVGPSERISSMVMQNLRRLESV